MRSRRCFRRARSRSTNGRAPSSVARVTGERGARRRARRPGSSRSPGTTRAFPRFSSCIPDPPPLLWVRGDVGGARAAHRGDRRVAGGDAVRPRCRPSAGPGAVGSRPGRVERPGARRGLGGSPRVPDADRRRPSRSSGRASTACIPPEHEALAAEISQKGLLVSELGPGAAPLPEHFPLRNRIISGISLAVVVVEASEKSGSLITARCALEQGRDVMAVPGSVLSGRNRGSHSLLKDGAKVVESAVDILEGLGWPSRRDAPASPV